MLPFSFGTSTEEYESRLKVAEAKLLDIARRDSTRSTDGWELTTFDTYISRSSVPCFKPLETFEEQKKKSLLKIHCVQAKCSNVNGGGKEIPLVNLHGYMNAGAYFYRNLDGLCNYFQTIYAVDMLGWGLSSRPSFDEVKENKTIESAEDFFVESLEAWRSVNNIEKMILSGHSFGAYVAVAYCERYPEYVDQLILLSPFGVPDPQDSIVRSKREKFRSSLRGKVFFGIFRTMFDWTTPGAVIRSFTEHRGTKMAKSYVERRLPEITDVDESETLAEYLYLNAVLTPSGEFFLRTLFNNSMFAKKPLLFRIPSLEVKLVDFMYGTKDWMDTSGGMYTEALCHKLSQEHDGSSSTTSIPEVSVYLVPDAGHLLILQNPKLVNNCIIRIAGGDVGNEEMPSLMEVNKTKELNESWLNESRERLKEKKIERTL